MCLWPIIVLYGEIFLQERAVVWCKVCIKQSGDKDHWINPFLTLALHSNLHWTDYQTNEFLSHISDGPSPVMQRWVLLLLNFNWSLDNSNLCWEHSRLSLIQNTMDLFWIYRLERRTSSYNHINRITITGHSESGGHVKAVIGSLKV